MTTLHVFGCSISQGFALPDVVKPVLNDQGQPLTDQQLSDRGIHWSDIHLYQPSKYAWPQVLADQLGWAVENHARRGACFSQISRQCAVAAPRIRPTDTVIVMWTYLSRISLQWPARTAVPLCHIVDRSFITRILPGFNKFFGLERSDVKTMAADNHIHKYIHDSTAYTYLDPMGVYNRYYNNLVLQSMTAGFLAATGARVIHLSVETESGIQQLERARSQLDPSLREPYCIPDPRDWHAVSVDHHSCQVILDPTIPPAENDMHPSVLHHRNFALHLQDQYFQTTQS